MSVTDELLRNNQAFAATFAGGSLPVVPARRVAIVACMDSRLAVFGMLGLALGDAHVIRNAGGVVTDDVLRSLVISQRLLGTREVVLVHHTDCGMLTFTDADMKARIRAEVGSEPPFSFEAFTDLDASVRRSIARIRESLFVPHRDHVRGFVYDVRTGALREVR